MTGLREALDKGERFLQVALDYTSLREALGLASTLRQGLGDENWLAEAGTPLIKSEGMRAVSLLSAVVEPVPLVADTKTADTGALEARLAVENGASIVTVLGCAGDETIEAAAREAHSRGALVAVDLIGVKSPVRRVEELASLDVDIVEVHIGIDTQRALGITAGEAVQLVAEIAEKFPGYVAVAGGLNEETVPKVLEAGASIAIVGGAITKSQHPLETAKRILGIVRDYSRK